MEASTLLKVRIDKRNNCLDLSWNKLDLHIVERSLYLLVRPLDLSRDMIVPALQWPAVWQKKQVFVFCGNSWTALSAPSLNQTRFWKQRDDGESCCHWLQGTFRNMWSNQIVVCCCHIFCVQVPQFPLWMPWLGDCAVATCRSLLCLKRGQREEENLTTLSIFLLCIYLLF